MLDLGQFTPRLLKGHHDDPASGACINDYISWLAGSEPQTDGPACVCPVIRAFTIRMNDRLDDEPRQKLLGYAFRPLSRPSQSLN